MPSNVNIPQEGYCLYKHRYTLHKSQTGLIINLMMMMMKMMMKKKKNQSLVLPLRVTEPRIIALAWSFSHLKGTCQNNQILLQHFYYHNNNDYDDGKPFFVCEAKNMVQFFEIKSGV